MASHDSEVQDSRLAQIIDEYTDQCVRGETTDPAALIRRHPDLASVLQDVLPAIGALVDRQRSNVNESLTVAVERQIDCDISLPTLPDFEFVSLVGGGGMGIVVAALDRRLNRKVAIKFLNPKYMGSTTGLERFQTEAISNARVQHPQIVQIYEVGEQDGNPYLVLEFCEGGDLATKTEGGPQDPRWSASLVKSLCSGLAAAHQAGLIHRDIKPANILFSADQAPKLADFGLAKQLDIDSGLTHAGTILGTPSYMAPEQTSGQPDEISQIADIYSLGAVLYELLVGRPPFKGHTTVETLHQVKFLEAVGPRKLRPEIPRDLETICLKCLHKEPSQRYQSAIELAADLQAFLDHQPIRARRITVAERVVKFARRSPWLAALMVLLPLSVTIGVVSVWAVAAQSRTLVQAQSERLEIAGLATAIINSDIGHLPELLRQMPARQDAIEKQLRQASFEMKGSISNNQRLNLSIALLASDTTNREYLWLRLLEATPEQLPVITSALASGDRSFVSRCVSHLGDKLHADSQRFRLATSIATVAPSSSIWSERDVTELVSRELVKVAPSRLGQWRVLLLPVIEHLIDPLQSIRRDTSLPEQARLFATDLLSEHAANDPHQLFELLLDSDPSGFRLILARLPSNTDSVIGVATEFLHQRFESSADDSAKDTHAKRQSQAAAFLLRQGHGEPVWPLLKHSPDPSLRGFLIDQIPHLEVPIETICHQLSIESETSIRFGLVLCLGGYAHQDETNVLPTDTQDLLMKWYADDPDPGLHSAIAWLRNRVGPAGWNNRSVVSMPLDDAIAKGHRWFTNSQDQTFAMVQAGEFMMGSSASELWRDQDEALHERTINRTFAIATTEVTRGAILQCRPDFAIVQRGTTPRPDCPIGAIDWYDAAAYCNWLSEQDGLPAEQWCYETNSKGDYAPGMKAKDGFLGLSGYRLPTEAEWEYACRAGTVTSRYYGNAESLLTQYAWYSPHANDQCHEVGLLRPNDFGLFDMLGNEYEWCHDLSRAYDELGRVAEPNELGDAGDTEPATHDRRRVLRGGSFDYSARFSRAAYRTNDTLDMRISNNGFRPARTMIRGR